MARRIVMWLEVAAAVVLVGVSLRYFWIFAKHGHEDPYGDARIALMGGVFLVVSGTAFAVAAAGLLWKGAKAWAVQLFPGTLVAWVLWNILGHR